MIGIASHFVGQPLPSYNVVLLIAAWTILQAVILFHITSSTSAACGTFFVPQSLPLVMRAFLTFLDTTYVDTVLSQRAGRGRGSPAICCNRAHRGEYCSG